MHVKIVLVLEYNGEHYHGWQNQPACRSIQSELEAAVSQIAGIETRVIAAGRTDAGVHALYQVVHFETVAQRPLNAWVRGVNAFLPEDIAVLWASEVDETFHARYCAMERRYLYCLLNHPVRPGLSQGRVGWFHGLTCLIAGMTLSGLSPPERTSGKGKSVGIRPQSNAWPVPPGIPAV